MVSAYFAQYPPDDSRWSLSGITIKLIGSCLSSCPSPKLKHLLFLSFEIATLIDSLSTGFAQLAQLSQMSNIAPHRLLAMMLVQKIRLCRIDPTGHSGEFRTDTAAVGDKDASRPVRETEKAPKTGD